jgi:hypothetical protein
MAQHHKRLAAEHRRDARRVSFDEGADLIHWAGILDDLSQIVLDSLDALVESTYEGEPPGVPFTRSSRRMMPATKCGATMRRACFDPNHTWSFTLSMGNVRVVCKRTSELTEMGMSDAGKLVYVSGIPLRS